MIETCWEYYQCFYAKPGSEAIWRSSGIPGFFEVLRRILVSELILRTARLLDPPEQRPFSNIVLKRLLLPDENHRRLLSEIEEMISRKDGIRDHRNKLVAHLDLETHTNGKGFWHNDFSDVLARIRAFLDQASGELTSAPAGQVHGNADSLLQILQGYNASRTRN